VPEEVFIEAIKSNKPEAQLINKYLQDKVVKVDMGDFIYLGVCLRIGVVARES